MGPQLPLRPSGYFWEQPNGGRPKGRQTRIQPYFFRHPGAPQMPEYMKAAGDLMKTFGNSELPPGLMPRWQLNRKNQAISRGMTKGL